MQPNHIALKTFSRLEQKKECSVLYSMCFFLLYYYGIREDSAPDSKGRTLPASVLFLESRDYKERYTSRRYYYHYTRFLI